MPVNLWLGTIWPKSIPAIYRLGPDERFLDTVLTQFLICSPMVMSMVLAGVPITLKLARKKSARRPVSRVLFPPESGRWPFLWDARCRTPRATDPDGGAETRSALAGLPPLLGLAPGGVCPAAAVAGGAVRSYRTISPLPPAVLRRPGLAVCFCGTFPGVAPAGRYPAPCFRGARTFLSPLARRAAIRPSGGPKISGVRREKSNAMNEISARCA